MEPKDIFNHNYFKVGTFYWAMVKLFPEFKPDFWDFNSLYEKNPDAHIMGSIKLVYEDRNEQRNEDCFVEVEYIRNDKIQYWEFTAYLYDVKTGSFNSTRKVFKSKTNKRNLEAYNQAKEYVYNVLLKELKKEKQND